MSPRTGSGPAVGASVWSLSLDSVGSSESSPRRPFLMVCPRDRSVSSQWLPWIGRSHSPALAAERRPVIAKRGAWKEPPASACTHRQGRFRRVRRWAQPPSAWRLLRVDESDRHASGEQALRGEPQPHPPWRSRPSRIGKVVGPSSDRVSDSERKGPQDVRPAGTQLGSVRKGNLLKYDHRLLREANGIRDTHAAAMSSPSPELGGVEGLTSGSVMTHVAPSQGCFSSAIVFEPCLARNDPLRQRRRSPKYPV